jgi:hypothetical protein
MEIALGIKLSATLLRTRLVLHGPRYGAGDVVLVHHREHQLAEFWRESGVDVEDILEQARQPIVERLDHVVPGPGPKISVAGASVPFEVSTSAFWLNGNQKSSKFSWLS